MKDIFWCKNCLNMSTRPRIEFNSKGWCNACHWMEEKKGLDWKKRENELFNLIEENKNLTQFDCIVPVSGGKDGTYVSYTLKKKFKINPLCVTIRPPMEMEIGRKNLSNFISKGFDHIHVSPNIKLMQKLDTLGFEKYGQGYFGWIISIHTAVLRIAVNFGINLIFYGEDGEIEYGGSTKNKNKSCYGIDYMKKFFLSEIYEKVMKLSNFSEKEKYWFKFPSKNLEKIKITHFSYFENWDSYRNYMLAKKETDLFELNTSNTGTFTNFAQNDQILASLHYYLMYIKFGFGRATQDVGIEIRRGSMTREQGKNLIKLYDGYFPKENIKHYIKYFEMNEKKFFSIIDKFTNKKLFYKENGNWLPKFKIQ